MTARAERELKEPAGKPSAGFFFALVLLFLTGTAHAFTEPSCPSGQGHLWTINYRNSSITVHYCTVNQTFASMTAMQTTCIPAHGVLTGTGGGAHMSGEVIEPTPISGTKYAVKSTEHFSSHAVSNGSYTVVEATHSCVVLHCEEAAGTQIGLTYVSNNNPSSKYCVDNCEVQMQTVMTVEEVGNLYGLVVQDDGAGDGKDCTGSEVSNVEEPGDCIGDPQQCQNKDTPGALDGPTPDPENDTDDWSGAGWDSLENQGCVTTESGGTFCIVSAPVELRPDNGTPGTLAPPDQVTTYHGPAAAPGDVSTSVDYYSQTTVNNSTNLGTGGDPSLPGNCGAPGQPACATRGGCGGPGQLACKVEITGDDFGAPGTAYDLGDYNDEIAQAEADLSAAINSARSEATAIFGAGISGGAGALPCPPPVTIFGQSVTVCLTPYEEQLSVIRLLVLLIAAVTVVGILLR